VSKSAVFTILCSLIVLAACANIRSENRAQNPILAGSDKGLFLLKGHPVPLWTNASILQIHKTSLGLYFLSTRGVIYSKNLIHFEYKNNGLPHRTFATVISNHVIYPKRPERLADLAVDPQNPAYLVTCTKENVFYSTNGGRHWIRLPRPSPVRGVTAVAIQSGKNGLVLYAAHPFRGIFKLRPSHSKKWTSIGKGLFSYGGFDEEIADIKIISNRIYAANSFFPHLYQYEPTKHKWRILASTNTLPFRAIASIASLSNGFLLATERGIERFISNRLSPAASLDNIRISWNHKAYGRLNCLSANGLALSGLSLSGSRLYNARTLKALHKRALYIPTGLLRKKRRRDKIFSLMRDTGLNAIVVDMKDDSGNLRFTPRSKKLKQYAHIRYPIDLKKIMPIMKKHGVYMIARIVVFKDKRFYSYGNFANAVRDRHTLKPWQGLKISRHGETNAIPEFWTDPYSPEVWKYNTLIAQDLIARGFDEIQFDYIRFPTDGINISRIYFPHRAHNMSRVSALMSFLKYARKRIDAPISLDIYGGNGWFRSGTFTGQDVETLKDYVNVICPMFYPSHFPADFLREKPEKLRTWRIYFYGTFRNWIFTDKKAIIRPYVQVFKLPLKYDKIYYGPKYIRNEIRGIKEALGEGESFWNAGGKYNILRKALKK